MKPILGNYAELRKTMIGQETQKMIEENDKISEKTKKLFLSIEQMSELYKETENDVLEFIELNKDKPVNQLKESEFDDLFGIGKDSNLDPYFLLELLIKRISMSKTFVKKHQIMLTIYLNTKFRKDKNFPLCFLNSEMFNYYPLLSLTLLFEMPNHPDIIHCLMKANECHIQRVFNNSSDFGSEFKQKLLSMSTKKDPTLQNFEISKKYYKENFKGKKDEFEKLIQFYFKLSFDQIKDDCTTKRGNFLQEIIRTQLKFNFDQFDSLKNQRKIILYNLKFKTVHIDQKTKLLFYQQIVDFVKNPLNEKFIKNSILRNTKNFLTISQFKENIELEKFDKGFKNEFEKLIAGQTFLSFFNNLTQRSQHLDCIK